MITTIKKETERIKLMRLEGLENVILLEPKKNKRITIDDILKPKKKAPVRVEKLPDYSTEDKDEVKLPVVEKPVVKQDPNGSSSYSSKGSRRIK